MKGVRELSFKCTACGSVANTLYMFHNQREVDDSSLARRSGDGSGSIYDLLRL